MLKFPRCVPWTPNRDSTFANGGFDRPDEIGPILPGTLLAARHPGRAPPLALRVHSGAPGLAVVAGSQLFPRLFRSLVLRFRALAGARQPRQTYPSAVVDRPAHPRLWPVCDDRGPAGSRAVPVPFFAATGVGRLDRSFPGMEFLPGGFFPLGLPDPDDSDSC